MESFEFVIGVSGAVWVGRSFEVGGVGDGVLGGVRVGMLGVGREVFFVDGWVRGQWDAVEVGSVLGCQAVGEGVDGVGDEAGIVAGGDRVVVVGGVGEVFGGQGEQVRWGPCVGVGGADGGDQAGPPGV